MPAVLTVRLMEYQQPGLRPTWLVTSLLDATAHPAQELVDLCHQRWRIETLYREGKHTLNIQNLRSHPRHGEAIAKNKGHGRWTLSSRLRA